MAITIERKEAEPTLIRGPVTYVKLWGQDRANLQKIAIWAGRSSQEVGEDLLRQAMGEVLKKVPDFDAGNTKPVTRRYGRSKRR